MNGLNRAIIAGNLARDPDVRYTVNKKAYTRFTVAVNYRYKDANGEYKDSADYIPVIVWGAQAESCGKYLKKGSPVLVEGRIQTGSYDAKDGTKRYTTRVKASRVPAASHQGWEHQRRMICQCHLEKISAAA